MIISFQYYIPACELFLVSVQVLFHLVADATAHTSQNVRMKTLVLLYLP